MTERNKTAGNTNGASMPPLVDSMRKPLPKRFYKDVTVGEDASGFRILLDGRGAKTPRKLNLAVPTRSLADAMAAEWAAQTVEINPSAMPITRLVCTALDAVRGQEAAVADEVAQYAGSDLLCYRAESPAGIVAKQEQHWDPVLAWAARELGAEFVTTASLIHVTQPASAIAPIRAALSSLDALPLAAVSVLTTLTGSAILAVAMLRGHLEVDAAWAAATVDEDWQIAQWGLDYEAEHRRKVRWADAKAAATVLAG
jgi:chaperone required for assembly of F1-ATPase